MLVALLVTPSLHADLASARAKVEQVRGKTFKHDVEVKTIKRSELRGYLTGQISKSVGSAEEYQRILEAMQLVDRDPKLIDKLLDLYESQVLAFYDPESHIYYAFDELPEQVPRLPMLAELVDVHELTHALQDQLFDAGAKMRAVERDFDQGMAYHALLEGEASLVMLAGMMSGLGQSLDDIVKNEELLAAMGQASAMAHSMSGDAPKYFVAAMTFPYIDGLKLVMDAYKRGGWDAVDALHANPPKSTEEVLHPEIYYARVGGEKSRKLQGIARVGKDEFVTDAGEFLWRFLLSREAAEGTDGGTVTLTRKNGSYTAFVDSRWDSEKDAIEFEKAYGDFLKSRKLHPQIKRHGRNVRVAYGADTKAARAYVK